MKLLARLFNSGSTPVTAQQLGEACATQALRAAFEGADSLVERLERIGVPVRGREAAAVFALVPFDRVIGEEYGPVSDRVREAMYARAAASLRALRHDAVRAQEADPSGAELAVRAAHYLRLFDEAAPGEGAQLLGEHAYSAIAGRAGPDPNGAQIYLDATRVLAEFFLAARVQTLDGLRRLTLIRGI